MSENAETASPETHGRLGRQSLGGALRDMGIAVLVLAGLFGAYYWKVGNDKEVSELAKQARELALKDTLKGYQKTRAVLKQALEKPFVDPYVVSLMAEVSVILATELQVADAKADAEKWLAESEDEDAQIQERYSAFGLNLLAQKKYKEADDYMLKIVERGAASGKLVNILGRAQRAQGKFIEAKTAFKRAFDTDWRAARYACDWGEFLLMDGDLYNATNAFDKALAQSPEHPRAMIGRARALIARQDRLIEANDAVNDVLARAEDEVTPKIKSLALAARGELLRSLGKPDEAVAQADGAIALDPDNPVAHQLKGLLLAGKNEGDAALAEFKKSIELAPFVPGTYFDSAVALVKAGKADAGVELMTAYEKALPLDERYHIRHGDLLKEKGDLQGALGQYDLALKIDEVNADGHYAKGVVLTMLDQYGDAETELGYALAGRSNFPDALRAMGDLYWLQKDIDKALEQYAQALVKGRTMKWPREKLDTTLAEILDKLKKAGKKEYAVAFEKEVGALIK